MKTVYKTDLIRVATYFVVVFVFAVAVLVIDLSLVRGQKFLVLLLDVHI